MLTLGYIEHPLNYRFARDEGLMRWTLEYLYEGHIEVRSRQGRQIYQTASVMLVPPRTPYEVRWSGRRGGNWKELYAVFDPQPQWLPLLSWPLSACGLGILALTRPAIREEVETALQEALQRQRSARAQRQALAQNAFERALLTLDEINPERGYKQRDERLERLLEYIAAEYSGPLTLEVLARRVYLSPSRLSHLFKDQLKRSPMQYVEQYRLERAAEKLLAGGDSIEQIAAAVGFTNAFHFSTRFRRHFGQSPSRYRVNPGSETS